MQFFEFYKFCTKIAYQIATIVDLIFFHLGSKKTAIKASFFNEFRTHFQGYEVKTNF